MIRKGLILYSPLTALTITWSVTFFLYFLNPFNLPEIKSYTWFVLLTGLLLIYLGFFTARLLNTGFEFESVVQEEENFPFSTDKIRILLIVLVFISFIGLISVMVLFFQVLPSFDMYLFKPDQVRKLLIAVSMGEAGINVPLYKIASHMTSLNSMAVIIAGAVSSLKRFRFISILPVVISALFSLLTIQRVYFIKHYALWIICSFIFIYYYPTHLQAYAIKKFIKKVVIFLLVAAFFLLSVLLFRTLFNLGITTDKVYNSFYFYIAGNVFLLDKYFYADQVLFYGASLFRSIVNWFVGFGLMEKSAIFYPHYNFYKIYNTLGNTFSYIRIPYEDFGIIGVIIVSYSWGWLGYIAIKRFLKSFSFAKMGIAAMFIYSFFWSFYGFAWTHLTAILLMFFQLFLVDVVFVKKVKLFK